MRDRLLFALVMLMLGVGSLVGAQEQIPKPDQDEWLRLIRNDRLDLILPSAMRDHDIDMWIHGTRQGNPDPLEYEFGRTGGFIIFTDVGDRIERAIFGEVFGGQGAIENIDVRGSTEISRALTGYNPGDVDPSVYDELREYVESHNPERIGVNYSDWLAVADGISYTQFQKLEQILGPELSSRVVSAEHLITDFRSRRLSLEVAVQAITLELARQGAIAKLKGVVPGRTKLRDLRGASVLYSVTAEGKAAPGLPSSTDSRNYVLQPGDFFSLNYGGGKIFDFGFSSFTVDSKMHAYVLREGETEVPEGIQRAWDFGKRAQGIMRQHVRVGMTSGQALEEIVAAMEADGYIYTPFTDDGEQDYQMVRDYLGDGDTPGFYLDLHAQGNNDGELMTVGASIAPFRRDRDDLVIHPNHIFAFEYAVHTNLPDRPGYPISINFSNPQIVGPNGVEWIQVPNYGIYIISGTS